MNTCATLLVACGGDFVVARLYINKLAAKRANENIKPERASRQTHQASYESLAITAAFFGSRNSLKIT